MAQPSFTLFWQPMQYTPGSEANSRILHGKVPQAPFFGTVTESSGE